MQIAMIKYDLAPKSIFIALQDELKEGSKIVINSSRGMFLSEVVKITPNGKIDEEVAFVRVATDDDLKNFEKYDKIAKSNKDMITRLMAKHNSEMKLVDVQYTLDGIKSIITFVCEDRVDFRDLVKELAGELKVRIELRQIGIRDQAKTVGCMGICGKECCCKQYLNDFDKVSIKMAKTQNLSLNPTKISGTCGRLMCCLAFENETYSELSKTCPKQNAKVSTPDGDGVVLSNNILKQTSLCKIEKGDEVKIQEYPVGSIKVKEDKKKNG